MKVRRIFKSEEELAHVMGEHFAGQMRLLHRCYEQHYKGRKIPMLKAASVAFALFLAAQDGQADTFRSAERALHSEASECIMMEDTVQVFTEPPLQTLVWDMTALMLEEDETLPASAQWAFDMVGPHVKYAYNLERASLMPQYSFANLQIKGSDPLVRIFAKKKQQQTRSVEDVENVENVEGVENVENVEGAEGAEVALVDDLLAGFLAEESRGDALNHYAWVDMTLRHNAAWTARRVEVMDAILGMWDGKRTAGGNATIHVATGGINIMNANQVSK